MWRSDGCGWTLFTRHGSRLKLTTLLVGFAGYALPPSPLPSLPLTVGRKPKGIVCIPMGMSYALLANLPPVYGLYTSLIPPVMYLMLGTCDTLSLGVSLLGFVGGRKRISDSGGSSLAMIDPAEKREKE